MRYKDIRAMFLSSFSYVSPLITKIKSDFSLLFIGEDECLADVSYVKES